MAALHLATRVFQAGNHIRDEQRDKEQKRAREKRQRNLRNLSEESRQSSRGRRRERNTKKLFTTVSIEVMFSFLMYTSLPHVF